MSTGTGVPIEGGHSDVFLRERASATPKNGIEGHDHTPLATKGAAATGHARIASPPMDAPLAPLQRWLAATIMDPASVTAGIEHANRTGSLVVRPSEIERVILPSARLSATDRLAIYRDAYHARLVECLADDYPALQYALGVDAFEALALRYVARHPSELPNLNFFGRHMSVFCQDDAANAKGYDVIFASELAALEWAMVEVLHAPSVGKLELAALATIPPTRWEGARFTPSTTVRALAFEYPVNAYFQAFRTDQTPGLPERAWSATAVFRDGATIWRMNLSAAMHALLTALYDGLPLGRALERAASTGELSDAEAPLVMGWFRDWVAYGFFSAIDIG